MRSAENFLGILTVKKPVKSSQNNLFFLNTNPLPPVSLGFLDGHSQIPFRQAASYAIGVDCPSLALTRSDLLRSHLDRLRGVGLVAFSHAEN